MNSKDFTGERFGVGWLEQEKLMEKYDGQIFLPKLGGKKIIFSFDETMNTSIAILAQKNYSYNVKV